MTVITSMEVVDWRYPTSLKGDGSDAVHKDPDVSRLRRAAAHTEKSCASSHASCCLPPSLSLLPNHLDRVGTALGNRPRR